MVKPYPNPTIQEAIFEIAFQLPVERNWKPEWFSHIYETLKVDYPLFYPLPLQNLQIRFNAQQANPSNSPTMIMRYENSENRQLIQISDRSVTFHVLSVYPGWEIVRKSIKNSWAQIQKIIHCQSIMHLSMRYINRIEKISIDDTLEQWFKPGPFIPSGILSSKKAGFASQVHTWIDLQNFVSVSATENIHSENPNHPFMLDISQVYTGSFSPDPDVMIVEADKVHKAARNIFENSKTLKLEKLLTGDIGEC